LITDASEAGIAAAVRAGVPEVAGAVENTAKAIGAFRGGAWCELFSSRHRSEYRHNDLD